MHGSENINGRVYKQALGVEVVNSDRDQGRGHGNQPVHDRVSPTRSTEEQHYIRERIARQRTTEEGYEELLRLKSLVRRA